MQVNSIAKQFYFTTVRIDTVSAEGLPGSGTGFICNHAVGEMNYRFIVTNKHVVFGPKSGSVTMLRGKEGGAPDLGQGIQTTIADWEQAWFGHPDPKIDVAICPLLPLLLDFENRGIRPYFHEIGTSLIPTETDLANIDAVEPVIFIGYPNGIWDTVNFLPVARTGTLASPLEVDFGGEPVFLVDASVFPGSSGSPVFVYNSGMYKKGGNMQLGTRVHFVGIVARVFHRTSLNELVPVPIPTGIGLAAQQFEMIDLGVVFKAHTVTEAIVACLDARKKW